MGKSWQKNMSRSLEDYKTITPEEFLKNHKAVMYSPDDIAIINNALGKIRKVLDKYQKMRG